MKVLPLSLPGLMLIELRVHRDERGFFVERFNETLFAAEGLPTRFVQDNHSRSTPGVVRGLHYQYDRPQGKLVGVLRGRIWDVVVDIRKNSRYYGKSFGIELGDEDGKLLWVPPGFAHGFCALGSGPTDVVYKVDQFYNPAAEGGIKWDDPELGIAWPLQGGQASARDAALPPFSEYRQHPKFSD